MSYKTRWPQKSPCKLQKQKFNVLHNVSHVGLRTLGWPLIFVPFLAIASIDEWTIAVYGGRNWGVGAFDAVPNDGIQGMHRGAVDIGEVHLAALFSSVGVLRVLKADVDERLDNVEGSDLWFHAEGCINGHGGCVVLAHG